MRLLNAVIPPKAPAATPNVYELRAYRCKPGAVRQWAEMMAGVMPVREKYSKIVGLWVSEAGQPNEAVHIWAYPDLNARAAARGAAMKDPGWQEFIGKAAPLLEEMHSTIMLPAAHCAAEVEFGGVRPSGSDTYRVVESVVQRCQTLRV